MSDKKVDFTTKEVDKNMLFETKVTEPDVKFYSVREEPFDIYGLFEPKDHDLFIRMPTEVAKSVNDDVLYLSEMPSGARVRFCTDSQYIGFRVIVPKIRYMAHMPLSGSVGFDVFVDCESNYESRFVGAVRPTFNDVGGYEGIVRFKNREKRYITINFPSYNKVSELYLGLQEDATLEHGLKYRNEKPVVFYGSSITQGGCASRPGNNFINIISRRLNLDVVNLGFSGSCKAEPEMAEYLSSLDMGIFVYDYDNNANSPEYLEKTHFALYEKFRAKNPTTPIIMATRPNYDRDTDLSDKRISVIYDSFRKALALGDQNVYYLDGSRIFTGRDRDIATVDGAHPNDFGFVLMANAFEDVILRIINDKKLK